MNARALAHILNDLYREGDDIDDVLDACERYLKETGRAARYPDVLREFARQVSRENWSVTVTLPNTARETKQVVTAILEKHGLSGRPFTTTASDLIGGYALEYDHTILDASYRSALLRWYTHCTAER